MKAKFLMLTIVVLGLMPSQALGEYQYDIQWGSTGSGDGQFHYTADIAVDSSDIVYVTDIYNHRVQKFDQDGNFLGQIGGSGTGDGKFSEPKGIMFDSSGNMFIVDHGNSRIQKFDQNGTFLGWFGKDDQGGTGWHEPGSGRVGVLGSGDGELYCPYAIATDSSNNLYVTDTYNDRVQKFASDGTYLGQWSSDNPLGIAVDSADNVYVSGYYSAGTVSFIQKYTSNL